MSDSDDSSSVTKVSSIREVRSHTLVEWKVQNFFNLLNGDDKFVNSPSFFMSRAEWFIRMYPNGVTSEDNGHISIFLGKKETSSVLDVSFTLGIKRSDGSILESLSTDYNFKKKEVVYGCSMFYERSKLIELKDIVATDGAVTLFCGIYFKWNDGVAEKAVQTSFSNGVDILSQNFKELFVNGTECDVTFQVNKAKFVAHQLVLAARSKVFQTMFKTDMLEKNSGIVKIDDSDPDCFKDFLTYIYSGELDVVSSDKAVGLYLLAEKYDFQELKVACSECMTQEVSADSVCEVVHLASVHDEQELLEAATQFFVKHANTVIATPKWFAFLTEHPTLANELFLKMANTYIK